MMELADAMSELALPQWLTSSSCAVCGGLREDLAAPYSQQDFRALAVILTDDSSCGSAALAACLEQKATQRSWVEAHRLCALVCQACDSTVPRLVESNGLLVSRKVGRRQDGPFRGRFRDYLRCPECKSHVPVGADSPTPPVVLPRLRGVAWCGVGLSCQGDCLTTNWSKTTCQQ